MAKIDKIKEALNNIDMDWYDREVDLLLENNYGVDCQNAYIDIQEKALKKSEILKFRSYLLNASFDALKWLVEKEVDFAFSDSTLSKALKEIGYEKFNKKLVENMNINEKNKEHFEKLMLKGVISHDKQI